MIFFKTAVAISMFIAVAPTYAKPASDPKITDVEEAQLDQISDTTFASIRAGKTSEAVHEFFAKSKLMNSKSEQLDFLASQVDSAVKIYGKISICEKVEISSKGSLVEYRTYYCQHENFVSRWYLSFLKTSSGWIGGNLAFKDAPVVPE